MKRFTVIALVVIGSLVPVAGAGAAVGFNATALEAGGNPSDVAVGDLDGKNGPDIVTALYEGDLSVQLNNGNGTFGPAHLYPTGCPVFQVELGDLVNTGLQNVVDGHLDAVFVCVFNGGDTQYLDRMAGDGNGGFGAPDPHPELNLGPFWSANPQSFALAEMRGPGLPPVPVFGRSNHNPLHKPEYWNALCATYDWVSAQCLDAPEWPSIGPPVVGGTVAQARVFTLGGEKGILAWGADSVWHVSTRELAPALPTTASTNFYGLTIGDLAGDGPDIISSAGSCGCGFKDVPPAGQVDVLHGNNAEGVPDQVGTKFASAPGVTSIATGDFSQDGHADLAGNSWSCDPTTSPIACTGAVFVQEGDGKGGLGPPQMFPLFHGEGFSKAPIRVADLDGNGSPDLVAIVGGKVQVLLNTQVKAVLKPLSGIKGLPKVVTLDKNGNLVLGTATNPPTASVDLTVLLPALKGKGKARASAKPKGGHKGKKAKVIGHADIKIPPGKTSALKVHLKGSAVAQLKHGKTLKAKLAIVAVATDGTKQSETKALTIKPPKKPKKHRH